MAKRIRDYVKYTTQELENYTKTVGSCMKKIHNRMHLNLLPHTLANIKKGVLDYFSTKKIGLFDTELEGIILDVRNIKILGDLAPISFIDANVHISVEGDFYIFQPEIGAVVRGIVKHISHKQIGVVIYRVFNASVQLRDNLKVELNSEIEFRIINFDLQNIIPFIVGELIGTTITEKEVKFNNAAVIKQEEDYDDNEMPPTPTIENGYKDERILLKTE